MPNHSKYPTLFDEVKTISISKLNKWGYLDMPIGYYRKATLTWSKNDFVQSEIDIIIYHELQGYFVTLSYRVNGKPFKYSVDIVSVPSNLGKGEVLYFLCPKTNKRCRKLYFNNKQFLHRTAFAGYYESQTRSKHTRGLIQLFDKHLKRDKAIGQLYSKHFKKYYAGKPTKRYLKVLKQMKEGEGIRLEELLTR